MEPSLCALSRGESLELTSDVGTRRCVHDFPEAVVARLVARGWRVAGRMGGCTPSTVQIGELLDERSLLSHGDRYDHQPDSR